jgi:AmmeMemoRadiSam system protein B
MKHVRKPAVAGYFYPSDPDKIKKQIEALISEARLSGSYNNIFGIISPHAGYMYSGRTAAYGFKLLKDSSFKTVVIISPSHREYFPGVSVYNGDSYETPLGIVDLNLEMADKLTSNSRIIFRGIEGHREEHAVEVQIPFLQIALKDFTIVPVVMGDQGDMFVYELAEKLAETVDNETLIVSSSDLSHYYSSEAADRLDSVVEKHILEFDYEGLQEDLKSRNCEACGGGTIVSMMKAASLLNKKKASVLNRSDSGDTTGDHREVVGYMSAVVYENQLQN